MNTKHNPEDVKAELQAAREELNRAAVHVSDSIRVAFERLDKRGEASSADVSDLKTLAKKLEAINEDVADIAAKEPRAKKSQSED